MSVYQIGSLYQGFICYMYTLVNQLIICKRNRNPVKNEKRSISDAKSNLEPHVSFRRNFVTPMSQGSGYRFWIRPYHDVIDVICCQCHKNIFGHIYMSQAYHLSWCQAYLSWTEQTDEAVITSCQICKICGILQMQLVAENRYNLVLQNW